MEYQLMRKWQYSGGQEGNPDAKILDAGTVLGRIEINSDVPMTPQQLADAIIRGLAKEVRPDEKAARLAAMSDAKASSRRKESANKRAQREAKEAVVEDA